MVGLFHLPSIAADCEADQVMRRFGIVLCWTLSIAAEPTSNLPLSTFYLQRSSHYAFQFTFSKSTAGTTPSIGRWAGCRSRSTPAV